MNPNYIGWSIVDWKSSSSFRIVKEGVISIKELNDYDNKQKIDSTKRKHISNIRHHAILEICKNLVDTAVYYRCDKFVIEYLKFKIICFTTKYDFCSTRVIYLPSFFYSALK